MIKISAKLSVACLRKAANLSKQCYLCKQTYIWGRILVSRLAPKVMEDGDTCLFCLLYRYMWFHFLCNLSKDGFWSGKNPPKINTSKMWRLKESLYCIFLLHFLFLFFVFAWVINRKNTLFFAKHNIKLLINLLWWRKECHTQMLWL